MPSDAQWGGRRCQAAISDHDARLLRSLTRANAMVTRFAPAQLATEPQRDRDVAFERAAALEKEGATHAISGSAARIRGNGAQVTLLFRDKFGDTRQPSSCNLR